MSEIIADLEQHISDLEARAEELLHQGEDKAADVCTDTAGKLADIAARLRAAAAGS